MAAQLGGSQISSLLESLPGIANVLRSPVADALVRMIRAGAGLGEFHQDDVQELVQYAVRRGLIGAEEGDELLAQVKGIGTKRRSGKAGRAKPKKAAKKTAKGVRTSVVKKRAPLAKSKTTAKRGANTKKSSHQKKAAKKPRPSPRRR